jgi:hypothetical protein
MLQSGSDKNDECMPNTNGTIASNIPKYCTGNIGAYACAQLKGYINDVIASAHDVSKLSCDDMNSI